MSKAIQELNEMIETSLGYKNVPLTEVKDGTVNTIPVGEDKGIVTCTENDKPYVEAIINMMSKDYEFKVIVKDSKGGRKARIPAGTGFGDRVWRKNGKHNGIELSFGARPDDEFRTILKSYGFRWSRQGGVWYLPLKKVTNEVTTFIVEQGFAEVESV